MGTQLKSAKSNIKILWNIFWELMCLRNKNNPLKIWTHLSMEKLLASKSLSIFLNFLCNFWYNMAWNKSRINMWKLPTMSCKSATLSLSTSHQLWQTQMIKNTWPTCSLECSKSKNLSWSVVSANLSWG